MPTNTISFVSSNILSDLFVIGPLISRSLNNKTLLCLHRVCDESSVLAAASVLRLRLDDKRRETETEILELLNNANIVRSLTTSYVHVTVSHHNDIILILWVAS